MAGVWLALCPLSLLFFHTFCLDVNQIQVPRDGGIYGVQLVQTKDNKYSFNATTAKEACNAIKMRIASKAEVETANKHGFQTCRFGWIEEQVAVVPRIDRNPSCGKNSTGISVWRADISKKFDVYCVKPAGPDAQFETTTSTKLELTTERRTPSTTYSSTISIHPSTMHSTSSPVTSLPPYPSTLSISSLFNTSSKTPSTVSLSSFSKTSQATTIPQLRSSPRTLTEVLTSSISSSSLSFTNTVVQHTSPSTGRPDLLQTAGPNKASIRAVPKAVVIVSVTLLLLLAAAGITWYLKIKSGQQFPSWTRMRSKHFIETGMWRHIKDRHCTQEQTSKDNNNRKCDNIIFQMELDPDTDLTY